MLYHWDPLQEDGAEAEHPQGDEHKSEGTVFLVSSFSPSTLSLSLSFPPPAPPAASAQASQVDQQLRPAGGGRLQSEVPSLRQHPLSTACHWYLDTVDCHILKHQNVNEELKILSDRKLYFITCNFFAPNVLPIKRMKPLVLCLVFNTMKQRTVVCVGCRCGSSSTGERGEGRSI